MRFLPLGQSSPQIKPKAIPNNGTVLHESFLVLVDKRFPKLDMVHRKGEIYLDETLSITCLSGFNGDADLTGLQIDSCWRFKVATGQITVLGKYHDDYEVKFLPSARVAVELKNTPEIKYSKTALG